MNTLHVAALIVASASPAPVPAKATPVPLAVPTLPPISAAHDLPYPASGAPQPGLVSTKRDASVPDVVTLDQAISIAVAHAPGLEQARYNVDYQRSAVDVAKSAARPSVSVSGSSTRQTGQQMLPGVGADTTTSLSAGISQLIFDGGQTRARIASARATQDATAATYRRTAQQLAYNVAIAYYNVLAAERAVAADLELVRQDVVSESLVRAQIAAGTAAGADISASQYTTAQARTALVREQGTAQKALVTLADTLGLDADTAIFPYDDSEDLQRSSASVIIPSYADALATATVNRPDLRSADLSVVAAQQSLRQMKRARSPSVSASTSEGLTSYTTTGGAYRSSASLGVTVSLPIYDRGLYQANIGEAHATAARVVSVRRETAMTVQVDVRNALTGVVSAQATLDQARAEYASAYRGLLQTQGQYRVGLTTIASLVQAQTSLAQALTDIVNAIYALRQAQAAQRLALGTG